MRIFNNRHFYVLIVLILTCMAFYVGCGGDKGNDPVSVPRLYNPHPANFANDVPVVVSLSWAYTNHNPAQTAYDLYFGTTNPPPLLFPNYDDTVFQSPMGPLFINTTYYWKVIAKSGADTTLSPIWRFTVIPNFRFPTAPDTYWGYLYNSWYDEIQNDGSIIRNTQSGPLTVLIDDPITLPETSINHDIIPMVFSPSWDQSSTEFLLDLQDGLYTVAYAGTDFAFPPVPFGGALNGKNAGGEDNFENSDRDTVYEASPVLKYPYPLEVGRTWIIYDDGPESNKRAKKQITAFDTISVQAGVFECYIIRGYWDGDNDGIWDPGFMMYEWLSGVGVVKRLLDYQQVFTDTCAVSPCTLEVHYEYVLQYYGSIGWHPPD